MDGSNFDIVKSIKDSGKKMFSVRCEGWLLKNLKRHAKQKRTTQTDLFRDWVEKLCGGPWHAKAKQNEEPEQNEAKK